MRRYNFQFDGTLKAGHDFTYKYDPKDPFRLLSVDAKEYRSSTEEVDTTRREHSYAFDGNGNLVLQLSDLVERIDSASFADTAAMQVRQYLWDEDNHLLAINDNGFVSNYFYDAAGERTVKISAPDLAVYVNGTEALKNDSALVKFVGYVSPYLVVSNGGRYTKHIYAGTQRIASKVGDIEAFGADPRRVEYAGANLKEVDFGEIYDTQTKALLARYDSLGVMNKPRELNDYVGGQSFCCGEKEFEPSQTGKDGFETPDYEHLIFFYHPDHLGSTALVTDNDGNVVQSVAYIPYGEVFIEERNGTWNTPYLFNGKELDEETGLYYYGARYLNPTNGMWLSVDPLFKKYVGMSPYNYCAGNPVKLVDPDGKRTFNIVGEDGVSEMIKDGVDETVNMHRDDFTVLKNTFESDNTEDKSKYNSYFNAFTTRPSYNKMQDEYPKGTSEEAYTEIGGKVAHNFETNDNFENTCAIRMSRSLNYSGVKINFIKLKTGSGKDNNWYFYKVKDLEKFIVSKFGNPEFEGTYDELQSLGLKGIVQFSVCDFTGATGHFDLYDDGKGCYNHCYGDHCNKVKLWLLPR